MGLGADRNQWAAYLRSIAEPALAGTPPVLNVTGEETRAWIDGFRDELGHRRASDAPLLARLAGAAPGQRPDRLAPEDRLWWGEDPCAIEGLRVDEHERGPLLASSREGEAIEPMTEGELCALHALWSRRGELAWVRGRCRSAAAWHLAELQPDNATGLPWAAHVFVHLAASMAEDDPRRGGALLHAEGLVHASCVTLGHPGVRAACVLLDAARELDRDAS